MHVLRIVVATVLLAAGVGCNSCEPTPPGEGEGEGEGAACVRSALLDEPRACVADDDCACGAHCSFTACAFDCRDDADCDGDTACDDFGRCSAPGARVPALSAVGRGRVFTEPTTVALTAPNERSFVRVYPRSVDVGALRLVARGDALVWCPGEDAPSTLCELTGVGVDGVEIGVGLAQFSLAADGFIPAAGVDVIDESGLLATVAAFQVAGAEVPVINAASMSGLYTGLARSGAGGGLTSPIALDGAENLAAGIRHAVTATLAVDDARTGQLTIEDPTGLVLPRPLMVLAVDAGVVHWPALSWLAINGTEVEVMTDAVDVPLLPPDGSFELVVPLTVQGLQLPLAAASLGGLRFAFTRTEALPANFSGTNPDADAVANRDANRGADQLKPGVAWETFTTTAFPILPADDAARGLLLRGVVDKPVSCPDIGARRIEFVPPACRALLGKDTSLGFPNFRGLADATGDSTCSSIDFQLSSSGGRAGVTVNCAAQQLSGLANQQRCDSENGGGACSVADIDFGSALEVDRCADVARATGCTVVDVLPADRQPSPLNFVQDVVNSSLAFEVVTKRCVLPAVQQAPAACTAATLCANPNDLNAEAIFTNDIERGTNLRRGTGDALCGDGALTAALGAVEVTLDADAEIGNIADCTDDLVDLARLASSTAPVTASQLMASRCFSPGRLIAAFDGAVDPLRAGTTPDTAALRIAHRLVQTVVETQGLVARTALDNYRQQITIDGSSNAGAVLAEIARAEAGWGFVLDPRVAGALLALPPEVLRDPDPRPELGLDDEAAAASDLSQALTQGVSISMLEALSDELTTLDFTLERAWFADSASDIAIRRGRIAGALRTASVVVAVAEALHTRALEVDGSVPWEANYQTARLTYANLIRRVLDRNESIDTGVNPLGIDDFDLPLIIGGDVDGDRNRFTAISRNLVGTGPGDTTAFVPRAVSEAKDALTEARIAWRSEATSDALSSRRIDDITRRYGELITGYCGASIDTPSPIGTNEILDFPLDTETCFLEPRCIDRDEDVTETLTAANLGFEICVATRTGLSVGAVDDDGLASTLAEIKGRFTKEAIGTGRFPLTIQRVEVNVGSRNDRRAIVTVGPLTDLQIPLDALGGLGAAMSPALLGAKVAATLQGHINDCEQNRQATFAVRPTANPSSCALADQCVRTDKCAAGTCVSAEQPDPFDKVDCYFDGAISEQALAVRTAALEVDVARAELNEFVESYDIATRACIRLKEGNNAQAIALEAHNGAMTDLNAGKTAIAAIGHAATAVKDCASAVASTIPEASSKTAAVVGCTAAAVEAASAIAVDVLEGKMAEAQRKHEARVLGLANGTAEAICNIEAELALVGAKAQTVRIKQAVQQQASATINLRGQKSYTAALWADGNTALAKERAIGDSASLGRFVLSDAAELYINRFRYAQRLAFVAVRGVEYEFQQGLPQVRALVTGADNPDDLEEALRSLATIVNNGTIGGNAPTGLLAVISLREQLLQLADRSANTAGEQTLTNAERFRVLLTSPRFAELDDQGRYLGQRIPFSIQPLRAFELGNADGIPIGVGTTCAERLWSVNAAVIGDEDLFDGQSSSFSDFKLEQRNTFASQRCDDNNGEDPLQVSTVRPSVNLLADFGATGAPPPAGNPGGDATREFATGLIQPYLNVSREEFEREEFEQGDTQALAARGVFGDYALVIPAAALSVDGGAGLKLEAVDDILLRLDYVAAAR